MLLWLLAPALADEADARRALWDALLTEAERGDVAGAVQRFQELSRTLGAESATQAEALYWLGHGLYELDRIPDARGALLDGIRSGRCPQCRDLLEEIELELHSVTAVPTLWTFDDGQHGLFHPFAVQDQGAIQVADGLTGPALRWTTLVRDREPDRLELGLRTTSARQVRFSIRSVSLDALIEVRAEDVFGRLYTSDPIEVPDGPVRRVVVPLDAFSRVETGEPLDPAEVARVELVDLTGARLSGANVLWIDDFEVR